jgi:hypothetical protein
MLLDDLQVRHRRNPTPSAGDQPPIDVWARTSSSDQLRRPHLAPVYVKSSLRSLREAPGAPPPGPESSVPLQARLRQAPRGCDSASTTHDRVHPRRSGRGNSVVDARCRRHSRPRQQRQSCPALAGDDVTGGIRDKLSRPRPHGVRNPSQNCPAMRGSLCSAGAVQGDELCCRSVAGRSVLPQRLGPDARLQCCHGLFREDPAAMNRAVQPTRVRSRRRASASTFAVENRRLLR